MKLGNFSQNNKEISFIIRSNNGISSKILDSSSIINLIVLKFICCVFRSENYKRMLRAVADPEGGQAT